MPKPLDRSRLHPVIVAHETLFARELGLDPDEWLDALCFLRPLSDRMIEAIVSTHPSLSRSELTSGVERTKDRYVTPVDIPRDRNVGRPIETKHPFTKALDEKGMTVADWARAHDFEPTRVKSWYREKGGRAIPRKVAEAIERELGVKATARVWKNGLRD